MKLKTLKSIDLANKTVLYRAPYDVGYVLQNGELIPADDSRITATLPTLKYLIEQNCKIVILTYVKRPDGKVIESLRTKPIADKISKLLGKEVMSITECVGPEAEKAVSMMNNGDLLMLENVRFHSEEMLDDDIFAKELCKGKDVVVFDAFPQAHRAHSSTTGILRHLPGVTGFYLEQEVEMLSRLLENPAKPFTVIIGGAKISDKVDAINNLLNLADTILVGGGVSNVFLKAKGYELGSSYIEDIFVDKTRKEKKDWSSYAKEIMQRAQDLNKRIVIPKDMVIFDGLVTKIINIEQESIPKEFMALDIGPETRREFCEIISKSKTVFLNGPMGKFEEKKFVQGSQDVLKAMESLDGDKIIGGGDTIDLAMHYGNLSNYSGVSLAGGATLEFLAGKELPALKALSL